MVSSIAWDGQYVLEQEADVELARQSTAPMVITMAVFSQGNPTHNETAALLAKAYGQYAYGFFEEDMLRYKDDDDIAYSTAKKRAARYYHLGKNYGLAALRKDRKFRNSVVGPVSDFEAALDSFGKKQVPLLFWTAFCWAGELNLKRDDITAVAYLPKVTAMIERVKELDRSYMYASPLAFRAVLAASRPAMLGGSPTKAKQYFEEALELAPNYFMTKVLYAQYYAVQVQDKDLFVSTLNEVLASNVEALPEQRLVNQLAIRRAELLLKQKNDLF